MNNQNRIEFSDIQLWLGELLLENRLLQKELERLKAKLEKAKEGLSLLDNPPQRKEKETD